MNRNSLALLIASTFIAQVYLGGIILPGVYETFPELNTNIAMLIYTLPLLICAAAGLILGTVIEKANKKLLIVVGLLAITFGGIVILMFGKASFAMALFGACLCGVGYSLVQNSASVLLSLANPEKTSVLVMMSGAFINIGSMICSTVGGMLAVNDWTRMYLTCLPAAITLVIFLALYRSKEEKSAVKAENAEGAPTFKRDPVLFGLIVLVFVLLMVCVAAYFSNYSAYVITDKAIGTTSETGMINTIGSLGGMIAGLFCVGPVMSVLKKWTVPIAIIGIMLPNLAMAFGTESWILIAALNCISNFSLQVAIGAIVGAGNKVFGPAGITVIFALQSLMNFAGPYIVSAGASLIDVPQSVFIVGVAFALIASVISIPVMSKAEKA